MSSRDRRATERRTHEQQVALDRRQNDRRTGRDRREASRVPLELWMEEVSGDDVYFRRTGNVGTGGVYFDRAIPHALGTMVTLKFALPGDKEMVVARGEAVSAAGSSDGLGMGVRFLTIEGDGEKRIKGYIRAL
ncbi:MAG: PilZ domain-containing protein [Deltaproteobacteria bacterium]|nr:PilZ domain-containing protein [Deltaproteobacteria bacterium]